MGVILGLHSLISANPQEVNCRLWSLMGRSSMVRPGGFLHSGSLC